MIEFSYIVSPAHESDNLVALEGNQQYTAGIAGDIVIKVGKKSDTEFREHPSMQFGFVKLGHFLEVMSGCIGTEGNDHA